MMTINLNLEPGVEAYLREKAAREGQPEEAIVHNLITRGIEWDVQDQGEAIEGVRRGLEASDAGRVRPAAEVFAEMRANLAAIKQ